MARINGNIVMTGISGVLGDNLVFYRRGDKQCVRRKPSLIHQSKSELLQNRRQRFRDAVAYARAQMADRETAGALVGKLLPGQSLYHALIGEFMRREGGNDSG
jgi:hypothetical protein